MGTSNSRSCGDPSAAMVFLAAADPLTTTSTGTVRVVPIRASKKSAEWCLKSVDQCWSQKQNAIRPDERPAAKQAYDAARDAYRSILAEAVDD